MASHSQIIIISHSIISASFIIKCSSRTPHHHLSVVGHLATLATHIHIGLGLFYCTCVACSPGDWRLLNQNCVCFLPQAGKVVGGKPTKLLTMAAAAANVGSILQNTGVRWITAGWVGFLAENFILSHNRDELIDRLGESTYHNVYGAFSLVACSSIAYGYKKYGVAISGPRLWSWSPRARGPRAAAFVLQALGLVGFSQLAPKLQVPVSLGNKSFSVGQAAQNESLAPPNPSSSSAPVVPARFQARCPIDFSAGDEPSDGVYGLKRVTRHPNLWSLAFVCLGTAVTAQSAPAVVMWTFPTIMAVAGGLHTDYRYRNGSGGSLPIEVEAKTSLFPFVAMLTGAQSPSMLISEMKGLNAALAVCCAGFLALRRGRLPVRI